MCIVFAIDPRFSSSRTEELSNDRVTNNLGVRQENVLVEREPPKPAGESQAFIAVAHCDMHEFPPGLLVRDLPADASDLVEIMRREPVPNLAQPSEVLSRLKRLVLTTIAHEYEPFGWR